jgi:hypothetical protein
MPERHRGGELLTNNEDRVIRGHGLAGAFLAWSAGHLQRFESNLVMQQSGGPVSRIMRRVGDYLMVFETLLERPRYLVLAVMAIFVVIL